MFNLSNSDQNTEYISWFFLSTKELRRFSIIR